MTVEIRPLTADDVPAAHASSFDTFTELDRRLGDPVPEHTDAVRARGEARVRHLQRTDPDGAWVAEDDGRLVGVALAVRRGPLWYLSLLTVDPELQGRGVGAQLLTAALRTSEGAAASWLIASADPKALRRYGRAGFALHPGYDAHGTVDRTALTADPALRESDLDRDGDLVDDVVTGLRGVPYGPERAWFRELGAHVLAAEDGPERGFCLLTPERLLSVGATTPALAQRLLRGGMARVEGEVGVGHLTADQQWAVEVVLDVRLPLKPASSSCRRGALGPLTPYLPTGAYG